MGVFYGLFGLLLATPLAVTGVVLVQMLYVQDVLKDPIQVLGQHPHHNS
jgi:predicted PurR-regulated permease PerM